MTRPFAISEHSRDQWLIEAVTARTTVTITCQGPAESAILKASFVGLDAEQLQLLVAYPLPGPRGPVEIALGQSLGIAFRRGHRKCVFETTVVRRGHEQPFGTRVPVLVLAWPEELHELQRRLYHRVSVPAKTIVPVDLCKREATGSSHAVSFQRGTMIDLSAGGMSVALPARQEQRWRAGDTVTCCFALQSGQAPQEITGTLRHCQTGKNGQLHLGLQFVGLETTAQGRNTLQLIHQTTNRFRNNTFSRRPQVGD